MSWFDDYGWDFDEELYQFHDEVACVQMLELDEVIKNIEWYLVEDIGSCEKGYIGITKSIIEYYKKHNKVSEKQRTVLNIFLANANCNSY